MIGSLGEYLVEETREEAREEMTLTHLKNMLKNSEFTLEQAMKMLEVPVNSRPMYASMIS